MPAPRSNSDVSLVLRADEYVSLAEEPNLVSTTEERARTIAVGGIVVVDHVDQGIAAEALASIPGKTNMDMFDRLAVHPTLCDELPAHHSRFGALSAFAVRQTDLHFILPLYAVHLTRQTAPSQRSI